MDIEEDVIQEDDFQRTKKKEWGPCPTANEDYTSLVAKKSRLICPFHFDSPLSLSRQDQIKRN
jgi:hypothetical protein